jgi:hypothetical protein
MKRMASYLLAIAGAFGLISGTGCTPNTSSDSKKENQAPRAVMVWPQVWPADEPLPMDLRASDDPDGDRLAFRAVFGDGAPGRNQSHGRFFHLFESPGQFELSGVVDDQVGKTAELFGQTVVVERRTEPFCSCEVPCAGAAFCADEGCFLQAFSDPAMAAENSGLIETALTGTPIPCGDGPRAGSGIAPDPEPSAPEEPEGPETPVDPGENTDPDAPPPDSEDPDDPENPDDPDGPGIPDEPDMPPPPDDPSNPGDVPPPDEDPGMPATDGGVASPDGGPTNSP